MGKSATEIADELFTSPDTAGTPRRDMRCKLAATTFELAEYALAFDLI